MEGEGFHVEEVDELSDKSNISSFRSITSRRSRPLEPSRGTSGTSKFRVKLHVFSARLEIDDTDSKSVSKVS